MNQPTHAQIRGAAMLMRGARAALLKAMPHLPETEVALWDEMFDSVVALRDCADKLDPPITED